ncbi:hypothetical protein KP001_12270 [Geomonas subterranea]|uniref:Uncharacterized protein n=1 Tax=Geomonas subterranea TaxID=2847989 RepID=A0ABX8LED7_9BACT|nr:hypothetical protein [Geomonas subterranea]QXE89236.1 hypothetical protein KP001_12270 [Geomonas subterranea]QXM08652.1 hypothetical protein KP002_17005 [Geomonas subterranea]
MGVQAVNTWLTIEPGADPGKAVLTVGYDLAITENAYKSDWLVRVDVMGYDAAGDEEGTKAPDILYTFQFPGILNGYLFKADGPTRKERKSHTVELAYQALNEDPGVTRKVVMFPGGKKITVAIPHTDEISCRISTSNFAWTNQVVLRI